MIAYGPHSNISLLEEHPNLLDRLRMEKKSPTGRLRMNEPNVFQDFVLDYDKKKSCQGKPCTICQHENCEWCPDCSPGVPEWMK